MGRLNEWKFEVQSRLSWRVGDFAKGGDHANFTSGNNKHAGEQSNASNENRGHAHHRFGDLLRLGVGLHAFGLRRSLKR